MLRCALLVLALSLTAVASASPTDHRIVANGVRVVAPPGWRLVAPAPTSIDDPTTVLVAGTRGVAPRLVPCEIAAYRIPPQGAAVVVVRWRTETSGGGQPPRSRAPLRRMVLNRLGFECWPNHRGGAVELALGGHAYQVNLLIGDRASRKVVDDALRVVRSFDLSS